MKLHYGNKQSRKHDDHYHLYDDDNEDGDKHDDHGDGN